MNRMKAMTLAKSIFETVIEDPTITASARETLRSSALDAQLLVREIYDNIQARLESATDMSDVSRIIRDINEVPGDDDETSSPAQM